MNVISCFDHWIRFSFIAHRRRQTGNGAVSRRALIAGLIMLLLMVVGCRDRSNSSVPSATTKNSGQDLATTPGDPTPLGTVASSPAHTPPSSVADIEIQATTDHSGEDTDDKNEMEATDAPTAERPAAPSRGAPLRLIILLPGGPLLCDVWFSINDQSHEQWLHDLEADLLRAADADHDGDVTWQEATTHESLTYGQWGNQRIESEPQRQQVVYRCDVNRDGRMNAEEIPIFLASPGFPTKWISIDDAAAAQATPGEPFVFHWLDVNQDRELDTAEIESAQQRLRQLDRDDDGMLQRQEIPLGRNANPSAADRNGPAQVVILHPESDWSRVLYAVEDRYAMGRVCKPKISCSGTRCSTPSMSMMMAVGNQTKCPNSLRGPPIWTLRSITEMPQRP